MVDGFDLCRYNKLAASGLGRIIEGDVVARFEAYFDALPREWMGPDFYKLGREFSCLNLYPASDKEIAEFFDASVMVFYPEVAFICLSKYKNSPALAVPSASLKENIFHFLSPPGDGVAFGLDDGGCFSNAYDFLSIYGYRATTFVRDCG